MGDKKIINVAVCAPIKDNKVLLIKRIKNPYAGYWGLPGGKVDFSEHPKETAVREVLEETGIDCDFGEFKGVASEIIKEDDEITAHFLFYLCTLIPKNENHTSGAEGEIAEVKWQDIKKLDELKMVPSDLLFLKDIILKEKSIAIHKVKVIKKGDDYLVEDFEI